MCGGGRKEVKKGKHWFAWLRWMPISHGGFLFSTSTSEGMEVNNTGRYRVYTNAAQCLRPYCWLLILTYSMWEFAHAIHKFVQSSTLSLLFRNAAPLAGGCCWSKPLFTWEVIRSASAGADEPPAEEDSPLLKWWNEEINQSFRPGCSEATKRKRLTGYEF